MDGPHSWIDNVHVITITSSSFVSTPLGLSFSIEVVSKGDHWDFP